MNNLRNTSSTPRVAIFYILAGRGHLSPALAMVDGFTDSGIEVQAFDFYQVCRAPFSAWACRQGWRSMLSVNTIERVFRYTLYRIGIPFFISWILSFFYQKGFNQWITHYKPDIIISNNSTPLWLTSIMTKRAGHSVIHLGYNTDVFYLLNQNTSNKMNFLLTPTAESAAMAMQFGQEAQKIRICPFPLSPRFLANSFPGDLSSNLSTKDQARTFLGLQNMFTLVLSLGGEGIGSARLVSELARRDLPVQLVLLGDLDGKSARTFLRASTGWTKGKLVSPGMVENVMDYLLAADICAGKAGANTVAESLYCRRPFLVTQRYYLVHRTGAFLEKHGVGWMEFAPAQQAQLIQRYCEHPQELQEIDRNFDALPLRWGAGEFARFVLDLHS